jgi:hypothetical protein
MKVLRDLTFGLLSAIASGVIVLGALSLALIEGLPLQPTVDSTFITSIAPVLSQAQQQVVGTITPITPTVTTLPLPLRCLLRVLHPPDGCYTPFSPETQSNRSLSSTILRPIRCEMQTV